MNNMKELLEGFSPNKDLSTTNIEKITVIGNTLKTVVDENFPTLRYPVIAGGAIRDAVFGQEIKDYDIFFDTSGFEADEKTDVALLLIALTCEKLAAGPFPALAASQYSVVGSNIDYTLNSKTDDSVSIPFIVYQNHRATFRDPMAEVNWDQEVLAPDHAVPPEEFPALQMIGHDNKRLTDDPLLFLEYFDYDLVKGLFDPGDMEFHFHPTMLESINKKEIKYTGSRTDTRVRNFFDKMRYATVEGQSRKMADAFRILDETPKPEGLRDVPFPASGRGTYSLSQAGQGIKYQPRGRLLGEPLPRIRELDPVEAHRFWNEPIDNFLRPLRIADEPLDDNF